MATFVNTEKTIQFQIGTFTDIGCGNRENQDDYFVVLKPEIDCCIFGIADGHGKYTGKLVANVCKQNTEEFIDANLEELENNTVSFLEKIFPHLHQQVRLALAEYAGKNGEEVVVDPSSGIVTSRKYKTQNFTHINGGSTFSIIIIKNGKMYIANVGDSTGLLCAKHDNLNQSCLKYEKDVAEAVAEVAIAEVVVTEVAIAEVAIAKVDSFTNKLVITREHSPENINEYKRIRKFRQSKENPNCAELKFVYDEQGREKSWCPPIFNVSEEGVPTIIEEGFHYYYKNVRKDRATYVATPFDSRYSDALASTRTIGDFNINTFGVSEKPEIQSIDLQSLIVDENPLCVVLASDGVWDNWKYEDVCNFVMDKSCLTALSTDPENGSQRIADSLNRRNQMFALKNFGRNTDNATGIVVYIKGTQVPL